MTEARRPEGALHRAPRPLIGWVYVGAGVASLAFLVALSLPLLKAMDRWASGEPVDWQGFAAIAAVAAGAIGQIIAQGAQWMHTRSSERRTEIAYGGSGVTPPFVPSPAPSPPSFEDGGLVNNQAIGDPPP